MARVTWAPIAQRDLRNIHQYIAAESRSAADQMTRRLHAASARLARFPESGRMVPEYGNPRIRELIVSPYRLVYRFAPDTERVHVVMVVHGSRLLPSLDDVL